LSSRIHRALAAFGLVATAGCAGPGTSLNQVWVDPSYAGGPIQKIFVIGVIKETARKRNFENTMAARFRELGIEAVPSWEAIPADKETDEASVRAAVEGRGFDSVIVSQLISVDKRTEYVPGSTYVDSYWGSPYYGYGYYPYYSSTYAVVHEPGYTIENTVVSVETNLYDVKTEQLKWAAVSETLNPQDVNNAIDGFSQVIIGDLLKQGFVEKK
jgi:hypothetical protein